jgi:hypothetical protein
LTRLSTLTSIAATGFSSTFHFSPQSNKLKIVYQ